MSKESDPIKNLLKPKKKQDKLVKSTYYLTDQQREKLEHFATLAQRGKSEFLRDILNTVFDELESEEQEEKADENSST